jgi:hypothetical protein
MQCGYTQIMRLELTARDLYRLLSPTECLIEAFSITLLFIAMAGCAVAALS